MIQSSTKKVFRSIFAVYAMLIVVGGFLPQAPIEAATPCSAANDPGCDYIPLTTIPGATVGCTPTTINGKINTDNCTPTNPVNVIKNIYGISIGIAAALAVVMIIWAGVQYATTESISGHSDAKAHWEGALWGLIILLSSYLILRTINVDLVNINLDLGTPQKGKLVSGNPFDQLLTQQAQTISNLNADQAILAKGITDKKAQLALLQAQNPPDAARIKQLQDQIYADIATQAQSKLAALQTVGNSDTMSKINSGNFAAAKANISASIAAQQKILDNYENGADGADFNKLADSLNKNKIINQAEEKQIDLYILMDSVKSQSTNSASLFAAQTAWDNAVLASRDALKNDPAALSAYDARIESERSAARDFIQENLCASKSTQAFCSGQIGGAGGKW